MQRRIGLWKSRSAKNNLAHISKLADSGRYSSADAVLARALGLLLLGLLEERDLADSDPAIAKELAEFGTRLRKGLKTLRIAVTRNMKRQIIGRRH